MKHFFLLLMVSFFFTIVSTAQDRYVCQFTDSLKPNFSASQKKELIDKTREQVKTESLVQKIVEEFSRSEIFTAVVERELIVRNDSAFLELKYMDSPGRKVFVSNRKNLITNGKMYNYIDATEEYVPVKIADSSQVFTSTEKFVSILGYRCKEYESINKEYKIWVTKELPSIINPGVIVKNIKGAILGFESRSDQGAITKSVASSINKGGLKEL